MFQPMRSAFGLVLLLAALVTACATTQLSSTWKDPSYQGQLRKVMVIGVAKKPINRRIFEDEFVVQLKAHGVDAVASYTVLKDELQSDQAAIAAKVKALGADAVLITRLVSKKTITYYVPGTVYLPPPYYGTWPDYYGLGYQAMYTPGYVAEAESALVESNLYDTRNDKLIWSALSETEAEGSNRELIHSFIDVMVHTMVAQKLLDR